MAESSSEDGGFDYNLYSSVIKKGQRLPVPEPFRDPVSIDDSDDPATFWGYNTELEYAFLTDSFLNQEPLRIINNRSYEFEKQSRLTIPKPSSEGVEEGFLGGERPEEDEVLYFYTDTRLNSSSVNLVVVMNKPQFWEMMHSENLRPIPESMRKRYRRGLEKTGSGDGDSERSSLRGRDEYLYFKKGEDDVREGTAEMFGLPIVSED